MLQNDPRIQQVLNYIGANGGDAQSLVYDILQKRGLDANAELGRIRNQYNSLF